MLPAIFLLLMQAPAPQPAPQPPQSTEQESAARCVAVVASPDQRVDLPPQIAPGSPPVLSFRYFEGKLHHRYSNSDLMLDDAGH